jgi:general secretion pathway protein N
MRKPSLAIAALAALLRLTSAHGEEAKQADRSSSAALKNPLAVHSFGELTATRDRPLFSPTRRPPPPPASAEAEGPPPPAPPPAVLFSGVIMDTKGALAILRADASARATYVRVGDVVSGWKVGQIERRKLTLSLDGRSATFTLFDHDKSPVQQQQSAEVPRPQTARVLEVNAAGVLRSHRVKAREP